MKVLGLSPLDKDATASLAEASRLYRSIDYGAGLARTLALRMRWKGGVTKAP